MTRANPEHPNLRDIGYRATVRHDGVTETPSERIHSLTVTAKPTLRLRVAIRIVPPILRALAGAIALALRLFPAGVRPTIEVVVTGPPR